MVSINGDITVCNLEQESNALLPICLSFGVLTVVRALQLTNAAEPIVSRFSIIKEDSCVQVLNESAPIYFTLSDLTFTIVGLAIKAPSMTLVTGLPSTSLGISTFAVLNVP